MRHSGRFAWFLIAAAHGTILNAQGPPAAVNMPGGPGSEVTRRVCGATCHGLDIIMSSGRSRDQWTAVVNSMIARGAKATDAETVQIAEYLNAHFGPNFVPATESASARRVDRPVATKGPGPLGAGAADSHVVDKAGADRGKTLYIAECITCHGNRARGGNSNLPANQQGADLVRSLVVLHDRYGDEIGKYLAKGHPLQSGRPSAALTKAQIGDLADYLHQRVFFTLRGGPELQIQNILVGDAKAGAAYFQGAGRCSGCHSAKGDMAGIGAKYDAPTLQSKVLFPRTVGFGRPGTRATQSKQVTVTVTQPDGKVTEGVLDKLDDFNVSLRDSKGEYRAFAITPGMKVVKHDPYAVHVELLDQYTDKQIHDVVAYLESLK